jgi:hypothetical protein
MNKNHVHYSIATIMTTLRYILAMCVIGASLLSGLLIYVYQRDMDLPVNNWAASIGLYPDEKSISSFSWITYTLPDALWMLSLTTCILLVWNFKWHTRSKVWYFIAFGGGILFEILQAFHLIPGTFDILDLFAMLLTGVLPLGLLLIHTETREPACTSA